VDEVQDLNLSRRLLAMRMAGNTGRIIAVGDHNQAIYGFTGADSDSMDQLKASLSAHELPLTMTYRCPKAVVREAQRWVPDFQAHDSNPEGVVRSIPFLAQVDSEGNKLSPDFQDEQLTKEDAILCRNTKPLVELAYNLIRRGIACRVEGREIGQGLITMARRWKVVRLDAFKNKVQSWRDREVTKYQAKGKEDMIQGVEDKADTIICLIDALMAEGKTTVAEFETFVTNLFGDTKEGETPKVVTLSTVHKSKGREWKRVFILGMNKFMPSRYAKKDWQMQQEYNLMYVAVTRSMFELVYVDVE
jgi:superfamily I DNA/RNA helicase